MLCEGLQWPDATFGAGSNPEGEHPMRTVHAALGAAMLVSVPMVHAQSSLPSFCKVGDPMQTPPERFHCPEGYEKLAGETPTETPMFVVAWHCRSTGYSLGATPWGGCAGSKGLAVFKADGWSLSPGQPVETTIKAEPEG